MTKRALILHIVVFAVVFCTKTVKESRVESTAVLEKSLCVAVLPLENRSGKGMAGYQVAELFSSEIITSRRFGVMRPVEAVRTLSRNKITLPPRLDASRSVEIGRSLGVDAVLIGTLKEYSFRGPFAELNDGNPAVSFDAKIIDTRSGMVAWSSSLERVGAEVSDVSRDYLVSFARGAIREVLEPVFVSINPRKISMPCWKAPAVAKRPSPQPRTEATQSPAPTPAPQPAPAVKPPPVPAPKKETIPAKPAPALRVGPAKVELVNASGNAQVADKVGMTLLINNHDLKKISDQKVVADRTLVYYKPGYEAEAGKIADELKPGTKTVSRSSLPADIDIQIVVGKDML